METTNRHWNCRPSVYSLAYSNIYSCCNFAYILEYKDKAYINPSFHKLSTYQYALWTSCVENSQIYQQLVPSLVFQCNADLPKKQPYLLGHLLCTWYVIAHIILPISNYTFWALILRRIWLVKTTTFCSEISTRKWLLKFKARYHLVHNLAVSFQGSNTAQKLPSAQKNKPHFLLYL